MLTDDEQERNGARQRARIPIARDERGYEEIRRDPDSVGDIAVAFSRLRVGALYTLAVVFAAFCFAAFTIRSLNADMAKKVDRELVETKLESIDRRLQNIERFQEQQTKAAIEAASKPSAAQPITKGD